MLAGGKLLSFGLSTNWERELLRADLVRELGEERAAKIDPDLSEGQPGRAAPGRAWRATAWGSPSRSAACASRSGSRRPRAARTTGRSAGKRSATGGALLAGDPHLPSGMPGVWYEIALELGGRFCRGASIPGLPGITLGQNDDVAWAFTNVMADVEDLFVERIEGESYEFEGERRPLEVIEELIPVRGREAPCATRSASPTTARSSTRRSGPTTRSRSRSAGRRSTTRHLAGAPRRPRAAQRPELVELLGG